MNYMYVYSRCYGDAVVECGTFVGCVVVYSIVLIWLPSVQAKHVYMYKCTYGCSMWLVGKV